ncbi:phage shock envelope stress response protein PspM [Mycobacteroides abscessus]
MTPQPPRRAAVHGGWEQLLRRLATNVNDLGEELAARMRAMSDKREKLLRKRLRAKRWSIRWALACVAGLLATTVLATTGAPPWLLIIPALLTAGCAIPATYLLVRYRYLKAEPLPPRPGVERRLPPYGSSARPPMAALDAAERSLFSLLGVVERGSMIPESEGRQVLSAANRAAYVMAATAKEVVSMERAAAETPHTREYLQPTIKAFTAQLDTGVRQYNELVTAAAQLVSAGNGGAVVASPMSRGALFDDLVSATDRLTGWAGALDELGQLSG